MSNTKTQWILELIDRVTLPLKNIDKYAKLSERSVGGVERLLDRVNKRSSVLTGRLKKMSIAAVAFGALSFGSLQFEQGMARANTMAKVGQVELAGYSNQIRSIADNIPKTKKELADGLFETISAGVPKDNWVNFLKDSSKSAYAGTAEVGLVVSTTSSLIKAYGDEWERAGVIQDKFQKTLELGQIPSLEALASSLPRVSAVASDLKVSQSELLSVFATASGVMGKPAEVGTQLNAVLSSLSKPGAEAVKMANQLGVAFNADVVGKSGGLKNYLDVLMPRIKSFSEQTGQTQQDIIGKLFGSQEAIKLVIGLGGNLSEKWGENTKSINNATGSVQSAFNAMSNTTQAKLQSFRNTFGNTMDAVFVSLAPLFNVLVEGTTSVLRFVNSFAHSHPVLTKMVVVAIALTGGLIFTATAVSLVSLRMKTMYLNMIRASLSSNIFTSSIAKAGLASLGFLKSLWKVSMQLAGQAVGYTLVGASMLGSFLVGLVSATAAQWGLNIALNANPIGLIVIGIAAAIGAIALMIKYWDNIKAAILRFTQFVWKISPFRFLINLVEKIFPGFKAKITAVFDYVKNLVLGFWQQIQKMFGKIKAFFGFGDGATAEVDVNLKPTDPNTPVSDLNPSGTAGDLLFKPTNNTTTKTSASGISGGGSGKTVTMNLDIKNTFNMQAGNWRESAEDVADFVIGKINDRLRDAVIAVE